MLLVTDLASNDGLACWRPHTGSLKSSTVFRSASPKKLDVRSAISIIVPIELARLNQCRKQVLSLLAHIVVQVAFGSWDTPSGINKQSRSLWSPAEVTAVIGAVGPVEDRKSAYSACTTSFMTITCVCSSDTFIKLEAVSGQHRSPAAGLRRQGL
jgi:hypothetical protein